MAALTIGVEVVHAAPAFPAFPRSATTAAIGRWLGGQTDLPLPAVVLIGPGYVFSFDSPDPQGDAGGLVRKRVREEVTSSLVESRLSGRSATAEIDFDCRQDQATASNVLVYIGNNRQGQAGRPVPAGEWLVANPGLYLMDLARAACDPGFRRPFAKPPTSTLAAAAPVAPGKATVRIAARAPRTESGAEHWVQVGAFANAAAANARWRSIQKLLPNESAGRGIRTEPAGRGGKSLVRALVGPFHGAAGQGFCTALRARGGDCLVR